MKPFPPLTVLWSWLPIIAHAAQVLLGNNAGPRGHGAVASESTRCSQIGIDLMKAGGNAADAVSVTLYIQSQGITA
jgi:hypothetical protein